MTDNPRPRRRPGRPPAVPPKQALNLRMDSDVILRLKRYALDTGRTASDVVSDMVEARLEAVARGEEGTVTP